MYTNFINSYYIYPLAISIKNITNFVNKILFTQCKVIFQFLCTITCI